MRPRGNLLALGIALALGTAARGAPAPPPNGGVQAQVDQGKQIFATSCANCHGAAGKGAIGPPLVDRNLSFGVLSTTILNGRVGTPMPPFKDELDSKSLAAVMAYAESITTGGRLPLEVVAEPAAGASSASRPGTAPVAVGDATGIPARGAVLFFDPTHLDSCRACHSFADKGGPIGPDLGLDPKTPEQIYASLSRPRIGAADYPAISLHLKSGPDMVGIRAAETASAYVLFDVSSIPPVKRTMAKSLIAAASPLDAGIFDHTRLVPSRQDRLDLAAYLGRARPAGAAQ
jgi:mono/diheme cytochrome c family protein